MICNSLLANLPSPGGQETKNDFEFELHVWSGRWWYTHISLDISYVEKIIYRHSVCLVLQKTYISCLMSETFWKNKSHGINTWKEDPRRSANLEDSSATTSRSTFCFFVVRQNCCSPEQWKNLGWLGYIGDYATQLYRDYNKINKPL